jgi:hypothetical protein
LPKSCQQLTEGDKWRVTGEGKEWRKAMVAKARAAGSKREGEKEKWRRFRFIMERGNVARHGVKSVLS